MQSGVVENTSQSTVKDVKKVLSARGSAGPWRGLTATLARDIPFSGVYWMSYETIDQYIFDNSLLENFIPPYASRITSNFMSGAISGAIAATITMPLDVTKTRMQVASHSENPRNTISVVIGIYKKGGIRSLFSG